MASNEQLRVLKDALHKEDISIWNKWRKKHRGVRPDLRDVDLRGENLNGIRLTDANLERSNLTGASLRSANLNRANLSSSNLSTADLNRANLRLADLSSANLSSANLAKADLSEANLSEANLHWANLIEADLAWANLSNASLFEANLRAANMTGANLKASKLTGASLTGVSLEQANLTEAWLSLTNLSGAKLNRASLLRAHLDRTILSQTDLSQADLSETRLFRADLHGANLYEADLSHATIIETDLSYAIIQRCYIYGISTWDLNLDNAIQKDLIISSGQDLSISLDDLQTAQFMHLILNNARIRDIVDIGARKAILILGHFRLERQVVLESLRKELRGRGYLPIHLDFKVSDENKVTETIRILAQLSQFIIVDLTEASPIPHELEGIASLLQFVPVQIICANDNPADEIIEHFSRYPWMLARYEYTSQDTLIADLAKKVIQPPHDKANQMKPK